MIEPTETEARETLDAFVEAMRSIATEAATDPQTIKDAPLRRPVRRLDEVKAAKRAVVKFGFDEHPDLAPVKPESGGEAIEAAKGA